MASDRPDDQSDDDDDCMAVTYQKRFRGRQIKRQCDGFCMDFLARDPHQTLLRGRSHVFDNRDATAFFFGDKFALHEFSVTLARSVLVIGATPPETRTVIPTVDGLVRIIVQHIRSMIGADHLMADLCTLSTSVATQLAHCGRAGKVRFSEKAPSADTPFAWYRQHVRDRLTDAHLDDCILVASRRIKSPHIYAIDQIHFDDPTVHTHALSTGILRVQFFKRAGGTQAGGTPAWVPPADPHSGVVTGSWGVSGGYPRY